MRAKLGQNDNSGTPTLVAEAKRAAKSRNNAAKVVDDLLTEFKPAPRITSLHHLEVELQKLEEKKRHVQKLALSVNDAF